ncbi:MAG TPA: hypothetical protein VFQ77_04335 [Pseudonocardiaceae bacterium]|nr:hypothetical protein [Pseudonocardiaceae bacterium]
MISVLIRTLILLRHAKSVWPQGVPDIERPLARRGRRDAPAVGQWLRRRVPAIDLVVRGPQDLGDRRHDQPGQRSTSGIMDPGRAAPRGQ